MQLQQNKRPTNCREGWKLESKNAETVNNYHKHAINRAVMGKQLD